MEYGSRGATGVTVTSENQAAVEVDVLRARLAEVAAQRDAALRLAESRARWLAHVSHELRTPMNGILGMTRLALDTDLSREQREHLDVVRRSADSLLTLINDTLDHARISGGGLRLERIAFNLPDALNLALKTLEVTATDKGVQLVLDVPADVPARVMGDPARLRQVVWNLVGNAIKFTERGSVTLRLSRAADDVRVTFAVVDTGIGIAPERLRSIFEPYQQADESTSRRYGGTGLGLTISRQIVELMGGNLEVASEVGRGTTFSFALRLEVAEDPLGFGGSDGVDLADLRVLVVSDNPVNRNTLLEVLDAEHLAGMVVEDPTEAAEYLRKAAAAGRQFEVLVFDLQADGLPIAADLLRRPASVASKALFITPSGQRGDAARCRELGIDAYLTGVVTPDDLAAALRAILDGADDLVTRHWLRERRRSLRVLLADDSATNRLLATKLMERRGHRVVAVEHGGEAVAAFAAGTYDVVLLDVEMPEMDGPTAAAEIRRLENGGRRTPVLALTGHISQADKERYIAAGMDDLIPKPFQPDELVAALRRATGGAA